MSTAIETLKEAFRLHQSGELSKAEPLYRSALKEMPDHPECLHLLGVLLHQKRDFPAAIDHIKRAISQSCQPHYYNNLGEAYRALQRFEEAKACYEEAVRLKPDYATAYNNLGTVCSRLGQVDQARNHVQRALQHKSHYAEAYDNLGSISYLEGRLDEAANFYRRALQINPKFAAAHNNLGNVFADQGDLAGAAACYQKALEFDPRCAGAQANLGGVLRRQDRFEEALGCYRQAIAQTPNDCDTIKGLALTLKDLDRLEESQATFRQVLQLQPSAECHDQLGDTLWRQGRFEESERSFRRAQEMDPTCAKYHTHALRSSLYFVGMTAESLAELFADFDRQHAAPLKQFWPSYSNEPDPTRPLRVGFVSNSFRRHPVGYLTLRGLENLDKQQAQLYFYSDDTRDDPLANRFKVLGEWRDLVATSDEQLAKMIHADRIDVLFNLAGLDRILCFARKPAPIQVTWIGHVGTTGIEAMDYILADPYHVPEGEERHYREAILRLPRCYACFEPPAQAPEPGPLPAEKRGFITFGGSHNPAKLNPPLIRSWSRILKRVPGSRLVLKYRGLDEPAVRRRFLDLFEQSGVESNRIGLAGKSSSQELLKWYKNLDMVLDPFPYAGGVTACESLWMGVPVVAFVGATFQGRHSASYLSNLGLTEFLATSEDEYVENAVALAGDLERLACLRAQLRSMVAEKLSDGRRWADEFLAAVREVWRRWCQEHRNTH